MRSRASKVDSGVSLGDRSVAAPLAAFLAVIALLSGFSAAAAEDPGISIELNKLELQGQECRAYFVIDNKTSNTYDALKLDLVLFDADGVIGQRFAVDLAPLKASKRTVKLFDIANTPCKDVGSFLINDVMECKVGSVDIPDCLQNISVSSRTNNQLSK